MFKTTKHRNKESITVSDVLGTRVLKPVGHFNPGRFSGALTEDYYAKGIGFGGKIHLEQAELVEWFEKKHKDDEASMALAAKLSACKQDNRCFSGACPKCSHAAQAFATEVVGKFLKAHAARNKIVCVSVVPADGKIKPGSLSADGHARSVRRWKDALGRAGGEWFIGATDWSFNEHDQDRYEPHWSEHFYGFMATNDAKKLKQNLRAQFPRINAGDRPVQVKAWDGDTKAIEYMLKPIFWRRIGTDEGHRHSKNDDGKRKCRATDKQPLRSEEKRDLLIHLDAIGLQARFLMRWLQFVNLAGSGWAVVNRRPPARSHEN
jgi:hypothetical protein